MRQKIMAYVVRSAHGRRELLVFEHRDLPEAGVQAPAGTVEPGESVEAAVLREVEEETGLSAAEFRPLHKLAVAHQIGQDGVEQMRHVFLLAPVGALPDHWSHTVRGAGEDAGMAFEFYWVALNAGVKLAGTQARFLPLLEALV